MDLERYNKREKLPPTFYLRDAREVARDLLGKLLVRNCPEGTTSGIIVETEAYLGVADRASHAFGGRLSSRTAVMYEHGGLAYVYFIYGMYWCMNVTVREKGNPEAVLIRAIQPVAGLELMRLRRIKGVKRPADLTNGPGKLCQALAIDGNLYGEDLCGDTLFILDQPGVASENIISSPRINIDYAGEAKSHEWRYCLMGNSFLSRI